MRPRWVSNDLLFLGAGEGVLMGDVAVVVGVNVAVVVLLFDAVVGGGAARACCDAVEDNGDDADDAGFFLQDG